MSELLAYFQAQQQRMIDLLTALVNIESPTSDKAAVDRLGTFMEAQFTALGADVTRYPQTEVGDHLLATWHADAPGKPILFLVHIDTVWPLGTLERRPVTIDDEGRLFGPGAVDMKGGIAIMLEAIRGLIERDALPQRPIWCLMTTDEETGSVTSTPIITELAQQAGLVLVMEPAMPNEELKTQRKGVMKYRVTVTGKAAHAGNEPENGVNAIVDLAQQILRLNALNDLRHGTSVSVTMVDGGIAGNVIPPQASAMVDVRMLTVEAQENIHAQIMDCHPFVPGAEVVIEHLLGRGPMERNERMIADFQQAKAIGEAYGLTIREATSGGGSDGNTTSLLGIPTLDGIGAGGGGLHAEHEHVVISSLPRRATLIAGILRDWVFDA